MNQQVIALNQKHSVIVNDGSGVLIQPMSIEYTYVLTAKHCIQEDKDNPKSRIRQHHTVFSAEGKEITVLEYIYHETKDIAILIVKPQSKHDLMVSYESLDVNDQVWLCGFPEDRRELKGDEYSSLLFNYEKMINESLILAPDTLGVTASNIVGFSGGGLFTLGGQDKAELLCAIETKMHGNLNREYHGKISAIPISEFEQLIEDTHKLYSGRSLAPLLPLHLSSFEHLLQFSFNVLRGCADDDGLNLLQGCLRETATENIKVNLFPHEILVKFKKYLKVHNRPEHELRSRELWVSLLELLVISILIDKPKTVDLTYLEAMLKSRRLMYIGGSGTWREYLTDILQSGLENLNQNGIIVTKTLTKSHKACFTKKFLDKAWKHTNIGRPLSNPRKIITANKNLSKIHSIVDLAALHTECIEAKEDVYEVYTNYAEFDDSKETGLLMMLAKEYGAYLTVEDVNDAK